jgi:glutaryl-CoA dehydrogenase
MTTTAPLSDGLAQSLVTDYFFLREQLTKDQFAVLNRVRRFVDEEVSPVINGYWERAELPWPLIHRLGELGIVGEDIAGYGCPGLDPIACGLAMMELSRGDGSLAILSQSSVSDFPRWRARSDRGVRLGHTSRTS